MRRSLVFRAQSAQLLAAIESLQSIYHQHRHPHPDGPPPNDQSLRELYANQLRTTEKYCDVKTLVSIPKTKVQFILTTMRHFGVTNTPTRTRLEMLTGSFAKSHRQRDIAFVGGYYASRVNEEMRERGPEEFPVPPDRVNREALLFGDKSKMKYSSKYCPHWILNDPDIAISKEDRKLDPW